MTTIIKQGLPATLSLVIGGVLLWLTVGLSVGILSATRPRTLFDRTATMGVLAGVSAPVFVLGQLLRLSRGSLLDTLGEDFIRTARAKGLTERRVLFRHAIRAAMTPVVSQLGVDVGTLLGGVVVVEQVFGLQGIGQTTVQAIAQGDGQVVLGFVIIATVFVVVANLVVDMLYAALDPHVRVS